MFSLRVWECGMHAMLSEHMLHVDAIICCCVSWMALVSVYLPFSNIHFVFALSLLLLCITVLIIIIYSKRFYSDTKKSLHLGRVSSLRFHFFPAHTSYKQESHLALTDFHIVQQFRQQLSRLFIIISAL